MSESIAIKPNQEYNQPATEGYVAYHGPKALTEALEVLSDTAENTEMWPAAAILTTNTQVENRQLTVVEVRNTDEPQCKIFLKLHNWAEVYKTADEQTDIPYKEIPHAVEPLATAAWDLRARITHDGEVALLYGKESKSVDGMVEISIDANEEPEVVAGKVDSILRDLTGEGLWSDDEAESSMNSWKENAYRKYFKLPEGPLTLGQTEEAHSIVVDQLSDAHIALRAPGLHKSLELPSDPGETVYATHEVSKIDQAIDTITSGGLTSTMQRLERGSTIQGRSRAVDVSTGGADVVYAYAASQSRAYETFGHDIRFVMRPDTFDRVDARYYSTDAYGSKMSYTTSSLDRVVRPRGADRYIVTEYESRVAPEDFSELRGVHEVCFEGAIGVAECEALVVSPDWEKSSFEDADWGRLLVPFTNPKHPWGQGNHNVELQARIGQAWGNPEATKDTLLEIGFSPDKANELIAGMNLPARERIIAKLQARGVMEINGQPVENFVVEGTPFKPKS